MTGSGPSQAIADHGLDGDGTSDDDQKIKQINDHHTFVLDEKQF